MATKLLKMGGKKKNLATKKIVAMALLKWRGKKNCGNGIAEIEGKKNCGNGIAEIEGKKKCCGTENWRSQSTNHLTSSSDSYSKVYGIYSLIIPNKT